MTIAIDKNSGNYGSGLQILLTVVPASATVSYRAERLTRAFQAGFIVSTVHQRRMRCILVLKLACDFFSIRSLLRLGRKFHLRANNGCS